MGAVRLIYDETLRQLKRLGRSFAITLPNARELARGKLRYCLQDDILYLPADESIVNDGHRLCWGRIRSEEVYEHEWLLNTDTMDINFDVQLSVDPLEFHMPFTGIGFGTMYSKRHREVKQKRIAVSEFISQAIIDKVADNPESLLELSKTEFEELMAEVFARQDFHVDLYRSSKDDGIDFLRVDPDQEDPIIFCVQCKHLDRPTGTRKRRSLPVATVREIYGVAKAFDLDGAIAITSSDYTPEAKKFASRKQSEIQVANAADIIKWVREVRWNRDE